MSCTLFSVSEAELQEAIGELPSYADSDSKMSITTAPVGKILELGASWTDVHAALGSHDAAHPLGFLAGGGIAVPSMESGAEPSRCFLPEMTIQLLAWVARLDDPRVRKLRQFLADAVLAQHGVLVHHFR